MHLPSSGCSDMFGYVLPPLNLLSEEERERFRRRYCGLCHTMGRRYGTLARWILNYDFTYLSVFLSDGDESACGCGRCPASPFKRRCFDKSDGALELAADESVILAWWQIQDGIQDHGFWRGLKYRIPALALRGAYRRAADARPEFDRHTRGQLQQLAELEREQCASIDAAADTFAELLAFAADFVKEENRRRILRQMLYHLGRWVYLIDAADDLKKDQKSGSYNPLALHYPLQNGALSAESRREFELTLDHSIHMIAAAYELWDFGVWSEILEKTFYTGLFQVGRAVLDGGFHPEFWGKNYRQQRKLHE